LNPNERLTAAQAIAEAQKVRDLVDFSVDFEE